MSRSPASRTRCRRRRSFLSLPIPDHHSEVAYVHHITILDVVRQHHIETFNGALLRIPPPAASFLHLSIKFILHGLCEVAHTASVLCPFHVFVHTSNSFILATSTMVAAYRSSSVP